MLALGSAPARAVTVAAAAGSSSGLASRTSSIASTSLASVASAAASVHARTLSTGTTRALVQPQPSPFVVGSRQSRWRKASPPAASAPAAQVCGIYISAAQHRQFAETSASSTSPSSQGTAPSKDRAASSTSSTSSPSRRREPQDDEDAGPRPRRSLLYVPGSSEKMIKGSQKTDADCVIFDLEDSVAPHRKGAARETVLHGLNAAPRPGPELAVRINPPSGDISLASDDLDIVLPSHALQTIVLPKVESAEDVYLVLDKAAVLRPEGAPPIALILSVESAASLHNMPTIISNVQHRIAELSQAHEDDSDGTAGSAQTQPPLAYLSALLFASEDFCASTSIIRTSSRHSLLVPRAQVVLTARAFGLGAIDMVCIDIKDEAALIEEAQEAKELGFDAKQVVHPAQVGPVQRIFAPSDAEVRRAARIRHFYERGVAAHLGAVALPDEEDPARSSTMIDAPMLKQADAMLAKAKAARMRIPDIADEERKKQSAQGAGGAAANNGPSGTSRDGNSKNGAGQGGGSKP